MVSRPVRLAVLTGDHHKPDPTKRNQRYNEEDMVTHNAMKQAFESLSDYEVAFWTDHDKVFAELERHPPDLVVNFCDTGFRNVPTLELNFPAYLELIGVPYTGAPPAAMVTCYDKAIVRLVAEQLGIAVPWEAFLFADASPETVDFRFPCLIKPNRADGSVGITKDAVVRDKAAARDYIAWMRKTLPGSDALIQEYLPGPEYGVGLVGNPEAGLRAFPPLEVDFSGLPAGLNPILSYESKAIPDSPYWTEIKIEPANMPAAHRERLVAAAEMLFRRLGLRDYGRFDFRVGADGEPKLMEVNPNPAWANDGKLALMAGFAGIAYPDMLKMVVEAALTRIGVRRS